MNLPTATYRLQLHDGFTLLAARRAVPYLARIGVSHLYLSPIFEARSGSPHGYDVTDPRRVRASLGGEDALRELAAAAATHDMGIILDLVPNHMAASPENPWWRDLLARGRDSDFASFFDIDLDAAERIRLPILDGTADDIIDRGELVLDGDRRELVYHDTRLPLAAGSLHGVSGSGPDSVRAVLARQHYEPVPWRTASERMDYRRFFDITDLAAVRVEEPHVFDAMHELVSRLAAEGVVDGLRIDHIDGLRDPAGYLERLRERVRGPDGRPLYTVVEKVLARNEALPEDWVCDGTTGYEFLSLATGLLIEPDGHARIEAFYRRITGDVDTFAETARRKKMLVMDRLFRAELGTLAGRLAPLIDRSVDEAAAAIREVTASMPVYRTYLRGDGLRDADRLRIEEAAHDALLRGDAPAPAVRALRALLLDAPHTGAALDWVLRWQQFTGPVMAKGFEDTALYCHNALLAANDVGSDPGRPCMSAAELHHALMLRARALPHALNATATHDTKRGEDTRARIAVLSEIPEEWRRCLRRWMREGDEWKAAVADEEDRVFESADVDSLLYQTLVGAWPLNGSADEFKDRIKEYLTKALREAKEHTSWRRPDEDYEQALLRFVERLMSAAGRAGLPEEIEAFARRIAPHGAVNSLAQVVLRLAAPGIPDIYQGTERWSFTLVDPDNRRPVDFDSALAALADIQPLPGSPDPQSVSDLMAEWQDGRIKLHVTAAGLRLRRRRPTVFAEGACVPVPADGPRAEHAFAWLRGTGGDAVLAVVARWTARLAGADAGIDPTVWRGTLLLLPDAMDGPWRDVLTGRTVVAASRHGGGSTLAVADLLGTLPVALLERA